MQAIEFEAQLNKGMILLPLAYRHWHEGQKVKIIVLCDDEDRSDVADNKNNMSCLDIIQKDVGVILNAPEDLSSNPEYLKGFGE